MIEIHPWVLKKDHVHAVEDLGKYKLVELRTGKGTIPRYVLTAPAVPGAPSYLFGEIRRVRYGYRTMHINLPDLTLKLTMPDSALEFMLDQMRMYAGKVQ